MEQLNSVTLRGIIGNARTQNIGDTEMARFSVATDHAFKNRSGEAVIETTWHQVTAFKSDRMPDFTALVKGAGVEVKGRLRNNRFTDSNGVRWEGQGRDVRSGCRGRHPREGPRSSPG